MRCSKWLNPVRSIVGFFAGPISILAVLLGGTLLKAGLPTLTNARAAHQLTIEEASRAYPVHFVGTVTYYDPYIDPRRPTLFLSDATSGVFAALSRAPKEPLQTGDLIDITGVTGPGDFAPIIAKANVRVIGKSHLPRVAPRVSLTHLLTGVEDGQWVEVEGVVRSTKVVGGNAVLSLAMSDGNMTATTIQRAGDDYTRLVDAKIRLRGNVSPTFNHQHQITGVHLLFPRFDMVNIEEEPPLHPFESRLDAATHLLRYTPNFVLRHRAHIRGVLTLLWPGRMLCLQDGTQALCAQTAQTTALLPGSEVDVIGYPASGDFTPTMTDAVYRQTSRSRLKPALSLSAKEALEEAHDSELVQLEGQFIGWDRATKDPALVLSSGKYIFPAILPSVDQDQALAAWKEGSILRITGICSVRSEGEISTGSGFAVPSSFRILMRSPQDVVVVKPPSWWSARHALLVLAGALAIILCTALALFRQVARVRRTASELRRAEEATRHALNQMEYQAHHDPLTGLANRLLFQRSLQEALANAERTGTCVGLLFLDLDRFKAVNDTLGHAAGDLVLQGAAERLSGVAPRNTQLARLGGDEFALLMPGITSREQAERVAERIIDVLAKPFELDGSLWQCPASVGLSLFPDDAQCATLLQKNADRALYFAKRTAPGQVVCFTRLVSESAELSLKEEQAVRRIVDREILTLAG